MIKKYFKKKIEQLVYNQTKVAAEHTLQDYAGLQVGQQQLIQQYRSQMMDNKQLSSISDVGFRVFSQTDEDGILLYLFALIGFTNKQCLDIAFASPYGANTTNLVCNHGFTGLLVCGQEDQKNYAADFFNYHPDTFIYQPKVEQHWITPANVNDIVTQHGLRGDIDLLSLDIDSYDYWVWKALTAVQPRVVVVEFNGIWPADKAVTVPYQENFDRFDTHKDYFGASLRAFVQLGEQKGYRFVGVNKLGFNAFFVQQDLLDRSIVPTMSIEQGLASGYIQEAQKNVCQQYKIMNGFLSKR